jgi:hypothetical protein
MRWAWILILVVSSAGCYNWRLESAAPTEVIERLEPDVVRVTGPDGSVTLVEPRISGDSIAGTRPGPRRRIESVPLDRVRTIEVGRSQPARTAAAVIAIPFAAYFMTAITYVACCLDGAP